jgi:hypothetical protein
VIWLWEPPSPIPGVVGAIPVAGFEIESSWRTRKHVKGDLLNLQDAGVALGVIVLAGADARDDSLRRFAASLVDRPGATILVWTHEDVRALASGEAVITQVEAPHPRRPWIDAVHPPVRRRTLENTARSGSGCCSRSAEKYRSALLTSNVGHGLRCPIHVAPTCPTGTDTKAVPSPERSSTPAGTPAEST